jgi:drug/metabolite transporter (DMT)-like permease
VDTNLPSHTPKPGETIGFILALVSALSYSTEAIVAKLLYAQGLAPLTVLVWRFSLAALAFWLLARYSLKENPLRAARGTFIATGLLQAFTVLALFYTFVYIPAGLAILLFYLYPTFVTIGSALFLQEPINTNRLIGLALTLAGLIIISGSPSGNIPTTGLLLALTAALLNAAYVLVSSRSLQAVPVYTLSTWATGISALVFILMAACSSTLPSSLPGPTTGLLLAFLALVPTVIALAALLAAISRIGPARTTIVGTLEPLFTALLGYLVLAEQLTVRELIGGTLIILAVLTQRR